jgi:PAS domain S-box-containing protein
VPDGAFLALVHNASLLLAMALVYDLATTRWWGDESRLRQVAVGVAIGGLGIALMLSSWVLEPQVIFDTRSILLAVSGLFFGTIPTVIAMAMTAALRLWQGGVAARMGVGVILTAGWIGLAWRYRRRAALADLGAKELYALGVAVHVTMLALTATLPRDLGLRILAGLGFPVLVIYPAATAALGLLMVNRLRRKRDADRLRESEERARAALYGIGDGVLATDEEARVTRLNRGAETLTGWRESEAIGQSVRDVLRLRERKADAEEIDPIAEVMRSGAVRTIGRGAVLVSRDGVERPVLGSVAPTHAADGSVSGAVVIVRDQTVERAREAAARERESVFRALFDQRSIGVAHVETASGRLLRVNERFADLVGYPREELVGRSFSELTDPIDRERDQEVVVALLEGRRPNESLDVRYVKKDGGFVWVTASVSPMWAPGEAPSTHILMALDVTERKGAETRMADLNAELERRVARRTELLTDANRELEAFSYSVSHDLRAPLRAIDGFSRILSEEKGSQLDDEGRRLLGIVSGNARKMGQLIDDLLTFSRSSRAEMRRTRVDMTALARAAFAEARQTVPSGERVELKLEDLPPAQGDTDLLRQVWANLVGNAVKFSALAERPVVEIDGEVEERRIVYRVRDNGAGFDMAYVHKLFGVFQRLHAPSEFVGTGVGLALVKRIVARHGGDVAAEGAVGRGATFSFWLPLAGPPSGEGVSTSAVAR